MIHDTTWKDDESRHWTQTVNNTCSVPADYKSSPTTTHNKSASVIHVMPSTLDISPTNYLVLNIYTGTVQNDTEAK